ncbi:glycine cleavage system protein R [Microlunatus speluncae]|uniref:glycine cleavage system protein R n=1 Tax=Microlunatus speluncae TaxID=2594267 RepID=UPI0012663228|nr:ACT domain-containing protein [Microlunatus speluncae]
MTNLAITVLGHDRPGIIARTADLLAELQMNLEDSSMTLLRGHFAMTLICSGTASAADVEAKLAKIIDDSLSVSVREVDPEADHAAVGESYLITVHGADQLGIVARLTGVLAESGGNITDLSTRLSGGLYVLLAEVDIAADAVEGVRQRLQEVASGLGVEANLRPVERDEL